MAAFDLCRQLPADDIAPAKVPSGVKAAQLGKS
jgi:hypothetical protein